MLPLTVVDLDVAEKGLRKEIARLLYTMQKELVKLIM